MAPHALLAQRILDNDWTSPCVCLSTNLSPDQKFQTRFVCLNCEFWCNPRRDICISSRTLLAWCRKERGAARVVQFASMHAFLSSSDRGSFKVSAKQKQIYVRTCTAVRPYSTPVQETARVFGSAGNGTVRRHPNPNAPFGLVERTSPFVTGSCPPPPAWRSHRLVPSETVGRRRLRACRLNTYGAVWFAGWSSPDQSDGRAELIPRIKLQGNCFDAGRCHSVNQCKRLRRIGCRFSDGSTMGPWCNPNTFFKPNVPRSSSGPARNDSMPDASVPVVVVPRSKHA
jgi:hypothetical protein